MEVFLQQSGGGRGGPGRGTQPVLIFHCSPCPPSESEQDLMVLLRHWVVDLQTAPQAPGPPLQ